MSEVHLYQQRLLTGFETPGKATIEFLKDNKRAFWDRHAAFQRQAVNRESVALREWSLPYFWNCHPLFVNDRCPGFIKKSFEDWFLNDP